MSSNPLSQQPQLQSIRVGWFSLVTNNNFKMVLLGQRTDFYGMLPSNTMNILVFLDVAFPHVSYHLCGYRCCSFSSLFTTYGKY